jgi:dienelactone hydrolase
MAMRQRLAIVICVFGMVGGAVAQSGLAKLPPAPADYGQWEALVSQPRAGLSPDGRWLAYGINRSNRENELRFTRIADGMTRTAAFGTQPVFSADSRWAAYPIGYPEAQEEKLRREKKPIQRKLGLINLTTGESTAIDAIESFAFDAAGAHLAMRRYAPERKDAATPAAPAVDDGAPPAGSTLIVRDLASGRDAAFGNVAEYAWQDKGPLLALAINAEEKVGNGVQLLNPETSALQVLDSAAEGYVGLAWRKESDDLAVLRTFSNERRDGSSHVAIAWSQASGTKPQRHLYDPAADPSFAPGTRIVAFRRPSWSDDGRIVFLGTARWTDKPEKEKEKEEKPAASDSDEEHATVDVWHAHDFEVIPRQKIGVANNRRRNQLAAWHVDSGAFVQLGKDDYEQVTPLKGQAFAYAANWRPYAMERSIGRPAADLSLVDLATGTRMHLTDHVDDSFLQASPGGRYLLFLNADHFWTIDTRTHAIVNITKNVAATFINREADLTIRQKPPFGVAGWTTKDAAVLLYDKFDIWRVAPDGSGGVRLTDGSAEQVRHRYVKTDPDEEAIDLDTPLAIGLFGIWTKKSGYAWLNAATGALTSRVWLDKSVTALGKAKDSAVYAYTVQAFDDSPDVFVGGADFPSAKAATATNPFQSRFAWGHAALIEYKSDRGERLQGALYYPPGYEPGKKYPLIVYVYERLSDGLHRYVAPSERDYYNTSVFTSHGYVVLQPDIIFRPREPGTSVVECVGPAIKRVEAMGVADGARVGVVGHSWGGFDTAFLTTHTDLFAAGVAGAPITDLVSNYGNHHWSSGIAETDHIETGQQRMEVPLYEDLPAYIRNSAVFNVQNMKTPLLIEVGDADGTVFWHQGIELYNIARRAKKNVVLLAYAGEDHGLRKKANQIDYEQRVLQWFGHYLKNEPAQDWIVNGVSVLEREQELKRASKKGT